MHRTVICILATTSLLAALWLLLLLYRSLCFFVAEFNFIFNKIWKR